MKSNTSPDEKHRRAFLLAAELIWAARHTSAGRWLIARTLRIAAVPRRLRLCVYCKKRYLKTDDPRIIHCGRPCAQQHRRVNARLVKEEKRDAA